MSSHLPAALPAPVWPARLLGLCPLLAVSDTLVRAVGLGLATVLVLLLSQLVLRALHGPRIAVVDDHATPDSSQTQAAGQTPLPAPANIAPPDRGQRTYQLLLALLVIVTLVSVVDVAMNRYLFALHNSLGIFVPLIASNCLIAYHAFIERRQPEFALARGPSVLGDALGMLALFAVVGATRELIATGGLLAGSWMLGAGMRGDEQPLLVIFDQGFALAGLAPGAFITLGLLFALARAIALRGQARQDGRRPESQNNENAS